VTKRFLRVAELEAAEIVTLAARRRAPVSRRQEDVW